MADDNLNKAVENFASKMEGMSSSFKYTLENLREIGNTLDHNTGYFDKFAAASREVGKSIRENKDLLDKVVEGEKTVNDIKKLQQQNADRIKNLAEKRKTLLQKINQTGSKADKEKAKRIERQAKRMETLAKDEKKRLDEAMEKAKKGSGKLESGFDKLGKLFGKIGFEDSAETLEKMGQQTRKNSIEGGGLLKRFKGLSKVLSNMGKANPLILMAGAVAALFKAIIKVNNEVAMLGRSLGVSASEAANVRQHFVNVANDLNRLGVDYDDILNSQVALNDALGTGASMISRDILGGMADLQKRMKLTVESTIGFAKAAMLSNQTTFELAENVAAAANAAGNEFGVRVDINKVMEKTGKIGGQLRAIYGANLEIMSQSVTKAQLLGFELAEIKSQSKGILDFQSSIEKEFKAELFLGKQLNLERARLASLTGDLDTYMDEITKNAGDFYEFSQMNVLQQDALAEALNMSSDQLADMLLQEENILDLRERARQEGKEQLYDNLTQLSTQEAFNAALEKMKKLFINIAANIENIRIPKWMSKMLTGRRDTLGGKRLADIANEDTFESSMKKLTGVTTNDDVYSSGGPVGGRRAPSLALNPPNYGLPVNTAPSVTAVSSPPSAITREDINNLTQATRENKTISVNKFGRSSSNYFDSTKFSYGKM